MRLHIVLALLTALALYLTFHARTRSHFSFADVQQLAQKSAALPYRATPDRLPPQLKNLTPEQNAGFFWNDFYRLWRNRGLPFQVDFYPVSTVAPKPLAINTVERRATPLAYSASFFHVNVPIQPPPPADLGYGGFYVRYPNMAPKSDPALPLDGFFSVLGGNYFRVLARAQVYGLSARALAINTIVENKEEFPQWTEWWLYRPEPNATAMELDALLDSPSVSGAYQFTLHPGAATAVDVRATLFFRKAVPNLGLVPFSSMYLYGENAKNRFGNGSHPEIHDSDGLLVNTGQGDWIWRPLEQWPFRQVYNFADENPRGFGLLQRDRNFEHYQDLGMNYNLRPSAWVTPHGGWGKGALQLIQLVTNNTNTDNVVLLWHPDQAPKAGDRLDLGYTIDFYMNDAGRPPLAYATQTLVNDPAPPPPLPAGALVSSPPAPGAKPVAAIPATPATPPAPAPPPTPKVPLPNTTPVQFLVDFAGGGIENIAPDHKPDLDLQVGMGNVVRESEVQKNDYDKSWRASFTLIPAKVNVPVELRLTLRDHGRALTETWTYTWHPAAPGK
jgi:glucans biosynthesis protein